MGVTHGNRGKISPRKFSVGLKERVTVLGNLNGEIRIWGNNRFLKFREVTGGYPLADETAKSIP